MGIKVNGIDVGELNRAITDNYKGNSTITDFSQKGANELYKMIGTKLDAAGGHLGLFNNEGDMLSHCDAPHAVTATQDASGNDIIDTYQKKIELVGNWILSDITDTSVSNGNTISLTAEEGRTGVISGFNLSQNTIYMISLVAQGTITNNGGMITLYVGNTPSPIYRYNINEDNFYVYMSFLYNAVLGVSTYDFKMTASSNSSVSLEEYSLSIYGFPL